MTVVKTVSTAQQTKYLTLIYPRGVPGFQVTGMIEGFFGFEIFNFGIFLGWKSLISIFGE